MTIFLVKIAYSTKTTYVKGAGIENTDTRVAKNADIRDF